VGDDIAVECAPDGGKYDLNRRARIMSFTLPDLPFAKNALEPHISQETLEYHHGKHHNAYVTKLNSLIDGTDHQDKPLVDIIGSAEGGIFNNAAQVWNHTFYWDCMKPGGGKTPKGDLADAIKRDFGSIDQFKEAYSNAGASLFGSGWVWLVVEDGKLEITQGANADLPMKHGQIALLTMDVWEHAYYIDYRNARPDYIDTFVNKLINWDFVAGNLAQAPK
jgi:Fe-Mn family superoxide dismutase